MMTQDDFSRRLNAYAKTYYRLMIADDFKSLAQADQEIRESHAALLAEYDRLTAALTQISEMEISSDTCKDHAMRAIAKAALNPQEAQS